jgi:Tol biopolymer transport system component/C-terminal processing protease CtpA/Prc
MRRTLSVLLLCGLAGGYAAAQEAAAPVAPRPIRGMRYPAVSPDGTRIAFSYAGDLWTVPSIGGLAKRVAELPGWDVRARWSPDGKTLAFCRDVSSNLDIYTIPADGGTPTQVTFHTAEDVLADWTPDGKELLFYGSRDSRVPVLYSIRLEDGRIRELTRDDQTLQSPTVSPDGKLVAYVRGTGAWARKGYRGSNNSDLYTLSLGARNAVPKRLTTFKGNDLWPMFSPDGKWLYYATDQDGTGNFWKLPAAGGTPVQVTRQRLGYPHYPTLSRTGKVLVYETDFSLWTVDPTLRNPNPVRLSVTAEIPVKPRTEERKFTSRATEMEVSPDGSQLALGIRGDIFLVPSAGGDAKRITESLARDYDFNWSPDGRTLVFVSEREANSDLYLYEVEGGKTRRLTTNTEPETSPTFSPDGTQILFLRGTNGREICALSVSGGERVLVRGPFMNDPRWSPDGRWVAFSRRTEASITNVFVAPAAGGKEINVSRWSGTNAQPIWSPDGKRLSFVSTRSGSPDIYTVDLERGVPAAAPVAMGSEMSAPAPVSVSIDAARIERRVKPLATQPAGFKSGLLYTPDGKSCLFTVRAGGPGGGRFGRRRGGGPPGEGGGPGAGAALWSVPAGGGSPTKVADGVDGILRLTADGKTLFAMSPFMGTVRKLPITGGTPETVNYSATITVDLADERRETFDQAWRLLRDNFYDRKMHGVDWQAVRARDRPIVDECVNLNDFHLLLTEMVGELNASHTGASLTNQRRVRDETANLGLWFDWSHDGPGLRVRDVLRDGPADTDETRIRPGEYVVAVAGKEVAPTESFAQALTGQAGKTLEVQVNSRPTRDGARTVKLAALSASRFRDLLYEDGVQRRREQVEKLSGGRLAYLHIKEMRPDALDRFERELLTEAYDHEGLVLDVRNNPGGRIHDELFALLTRKVHVFETPRDGLKMTQPFGAFYRASILLINQSSFSDAEIFANGFRANGIGKVVGVPTGGGVIGTRDQPLLDGQTTFRVPQTGWQALDGTNLENYGVPPDFYVELEPADVLADRDPQLQRAVGELLKQIEAKSTAPAKNPTRRPGMGRTGGKKAPRT